MFTTKKIAVVSVINDLITDNRVNKTCNVLIESGYDVVLIGRILPHSLAIPSWPFKSIRLKLFFIKGPLFYFFFNIRLFFKLLFIKTDLLFANDLDTLIPNFLVSKIKNIPLIYDSHELFCEVPELLNSPFKRKVWLKIETYIVPKLKNCITVNESIAKIFKDKYHVKFNVVRNISDSFTDFVPKTRQALNLPLDKKIIIFQGAGINIDRGAEELIEAMCFVEDAVLLIIGSGDVWTKLEEMVKDRNLKEKIILVKKIPKKELMSYTYNADLGISIDKNTNPNYYNSLPNKIFDYIHAGVPILASRLPEIENIITKFKIGWFIDSHQPQQIASAINKVFLSSELNEYRERTTAAAIELTWENEKIKLLSIINQIK